MLTKLPCSHLYHGDCIVQRLDKNHMCPLCRCQMPIPEEADEPWDPFGRQLSWPMLLKVSANTIAGMLRCCRLLEQI
ncbi:putative transcription factor C2H2 family [Rosa chinensis]|uniref:Putative transcription factor C2H2 family n=1 Tax=Rosa chinensis TaxID=74649 RepID=A0A2P6PI45_ROSCH|nr:putative transcription factor C2H2 family [Rosa chinensis]